MNNRIILFVVLFVAIAFSAHAKEIDDPIRFAIIGDRTGGHTPGVYGDIIKEIELLKPDFTMAVGDMIEGFTSDVDQIRREWEEYQTLIEPLTAPIYHTPGNHDIWGEEGDKSLDLYNEFVGDAFYSFDKQDVHFVIMDNSRWNNSDEIPGDQIKWLTKDLKKHKKAPYTLVFFHKPFWFNSLATGKPDALHDIFVEHGVDAVFTGHFHTYFSGEYDGIIYTSMGSSGGAATTGVTGMLYHYAWVTLNSDGIHIALVKKGSVLPWNEVTADDLHLISAIQQSAIRSDDTIKVIGGKVDQTPFSVTIKNDYKYEVDDEIVWDVPDGWTVQPISMRVTVPPSAIETFRFTAECAGVLYPVPTLKLNYPYDDGKTFELESSLLIERTVSCSKTMTEPTIDGMVSEGEVWQHGETVFFPPDGRELMIDPVSFHFAYDDKNIYLGAVCQESEMDSLVSNVTEHDGAIYGEDCVGFFISPLREGDANFQLYFNPNAVAFDQKITVNEGRAVSVDKEWTCIYEAKTAKRDNFWAIEVMIPFNQFGTSPETGDEWKVNFRRKQARVSSSGDWIIPISYDPMTYGVLKFE